MTQKTLWDCISFVTRNPQLRSVGRTSQREHAQAFPCERSRFRQRSRIREQGRKHEHNNPVRIQSVDTLSTLRLHCFSDQKFSAPVTGKDISELRRHFGSALSGQPQCPSGRSPNPGAASLSRAFQHSDFFSLEPSTFSLAPSLQALCSSRTSDFGLRTSPDCTSSFTKVLGQFRGSGPTGPRSSGPSGRSATRCQKDISHRYECNIAPAAPRPRPVGRPATVPLSPCVLVHRAAPSRGVSRMRQARFQLSSPGARRPIQADRFQTCFPRMRSGNPMNSGGTLR